MLMAGCDRHQNSGTQTADWSYGTSGTNSITNNTYVAGRGYWHAPYFNWYPYPYNHFMPSLGYYYGGGWHGMPDRNPISSSFPYGSAGHSSTYGSYGGGIYGGSSSASASSSVSRGGFGSSAHGSSSAGT
jgi:hypothetical protein